MRNRIFMGWKNRLCQCPCSSVMRMIKPLLTNNTLFTGNAISQIDFTRMDDIIKEYIDPDGPKDWSSALARMLDNQSALLLVETLLRCRCCASHARYMVEAVEQLDEGMSFTES